MKTPAVTILMPVYNASRHLREAIDSIVNQSFEAFEFLIIDDGSTDDSARIIQSYSDQRIVFLKNNANLGISATLNRGILLASAELIARMDADDICHPKRIEKQYQYMRHNPDCALLSTWANVVTEDKKFIRLERYRHNFYYYNLTFECWMYHPTIMFRKKAVREAGMYTMPYSEDYDLFWRISTRHKIDNLTEPLLDYRLSVTSLNTVLKKLEYDEANEQNVLRNIRYYMGDDFPLSKPVLECLRHNFEPMAKLNDPEQVIECLQVLDRITEKILAKENPNRDEESIRRAYYFKRKFMLTELSKSLPKLKSLALLIRVRAWAALYALGVHSIQWRMKAIIRAMLV